MLFAFSALLLDFSIATVERWLDTKAINYDIHILVVAKFFVVIENAESLH